MNTTDGAEAAVRSAETWEQAEALAEAARDKCCLAVEAARRADKTAQAEWVAWMEARRIAGEALRLKTEASERLSANGGKERRES